MSALKTLVVIAPWGWDNGWRLGGARVETAATPDALNAVLESVIGHADAGIIALPDTMKDWVSDKHRRAVKKSLFPLLAYYSPPGKMADVQAEEVEDLVRQAIGYRLKITL